jgi:putrescine importer
MKLRIAATDNMATSPRPRRVLRFRDLIFYGVVVITPIAPVPIYGVAQELSHGHVILSLVLAGIAMMLTAFSYGRMASLYPSAGSAYVYVGRALSPRLGFVAGWTMTLDYLVLPMVAIIQVALALQRLSPSVPYTAWVTLLVVVITLLNLRGIKTTARASTALLASMTVVIGAFLVFSVKYLTSMFGWQGLLSLKPIYDPATFNVAAIVTGTSFAALTYIGFDGLTTLAEDVENPKRTIPLATISVCLFTAIFSCVLVYFAQLLHPDYKSFTNIETAFMDVTRIAGGETLFQSMGLVIIISSFGAALAGEVAASRLLLAMGRDNVLPSAMFARLSAKSQTPVANIVLISGIAWIGSTVLSLEHAGELLNFGALLGFMGVNLAAFTQCYWLQTRGSRRFLTDACVPLAGFCFCAAIWLNLQMPAKLTGGTWLFLGITYYSLRKRFSPTTESESVDQSAKKASSNI